MRNGKRKVGNEVHGDNPEALKALLPFYTIEYKSESGLDVKGQLDKLFGGTK